MILGSFVFHLCVSRRSLQLTLASVCWCWLGCFLLFSVGELNFDLFLTSSNNLTATVESNAATEKKPLVLKGSRPCGGVRRARMQRELFLQQHGLQ